MGQAVSPFETMGRRKMRGDDEGGPWVSLLLFFVGYDQKKINNIQIVRFSFDVDRKETPILAHMLIHVIQPGRAIA